MQNTALAYQEDYGVRAPWLPSDEKQGQSASQRDPEEGKTATNPQTGQRIVKRNGQWVAL